MLKKHIELVISIYYAYKAYLHIFRRMLNVLMCSLGLWDWSRDWGRDWSVRLLPASESQSHLRRQFLEKHKKCKKRMNARQRPVHDTIRCILLSVRCKHTASLHTHTHSHTDTLACRAGWLARQRRSSGAKGKARREVRIFFNN